MIVTAPNDTELNELVEKLRAHRRELLDVAGTLTDEEAGVQPNGEWSAKQQLAHAASAERVWREGAFFTLNSEGGL
ncbi:MAG: DinB family protein, partial [SAR202 cluster bacterium]|nr:DinB family protein [SAR202 cluster bacterium]